MAWTKIKRNDLISVMRHQEGKYDVELFRKFVVDNDLQYALSDIGFGTTIKRFFENGGIQAGKSDLSVKSIPKMDHYYFYRNSKKEIYLTSNSHSSYESISKDLEQWNDGSFNINIVDSSKSWYWPNETVLIVITLKGVNVKY